MLMAVNMKEIDIDLGRLLSQASANRKKIFIHTLVRIVLVLTISFLGIGGLGGFSKWFSNLKSISIFSIIFIPSLLWSMLPLMHLKNSLKFYERGLSFNGIKYNFENLGIITFCDYTCGFKTEQFMKSSLRNFNVTYIERPKKAYNESYMKND